MLKFAKKINKIVYLLKQLKQRNMKDVTITPPKGFIIDEEKSTFQKIVFKEIKKDIFERIQSFDDACREVGTTKKEFEKKYKDILDNQGYATEQFKLLVKAYNEGTVLDWDNINEQKWCIWWDMRKSGSLGAFNDRYRYSHAPASLHFKSIAIGEDIYKKFESIIRIYFKG